MRRLLFALLLATTACVAQEPESHSSNPTKPDAGGPEIDPEDDHVSFSFAGLPPDSYWDSVSVHGQGPANGSVLVEADSGTVSVELGSGGSFCVDVPLFKGALNSLTLVAIDERGRRSDPQTAQIRQDGEPPSPGEPIPPQNIAKGGLLIDDSTVTVSEGFMGAISDGDPGTGVLLREELLHFDGFYEVAWMTLQIPVADGVEKIRVTSDLACPMEEYLVHTAPAVFTDMPYPGYEDIDSAPWAFRGHHGPQGTVTDCSTSQYACQEYNFPSAVVGAIGIYLSSRDCSSFLGIGYHHIREIEAWTPAGVAPPEVVAPSCQSGS